jgi:hypothetical protein
MRIPIPTTATERVIQPAPMLLLRAWAQHCCGTANWSSSMGRAGPWRSSDESAVGHRSAASPGRRREIDPYPRRTPQLGIIDQLALGSQHT